MNNNKLFPHGIHNVLSWPRCSLGFIYPTLAALTFLFVAMQAGAADLLTYIVSAKDGHFIPNTVNVPAAVRFKIVLRNEGHDAIEFESLQLRKEKVLAPGAESFVVIAPLKPGEYEFFDEFHPDTGRVRIIVK